jgi:microcystin-dependent protein
VLEEIVVATSLASGTTLNVTRAAESGSTAPGSTAKVHSQGNVVRHMITARDLQDFTDHYNNTTTAHGVTGEVVGTTKSQTLTLKTLTSPIINSPVINTPTINAGAGGTLAISSTELGYLDGTTGAIQSQIDLKASIANLDLKAPITNPSFLGTVTLPTGTVTSGMISDGTIVNADINASAAIDWTKLAISSTVSSTELGYLDGVTSLIQTQINSIIPTGSVSMFGGATAPTGWLSCDGSAVSRTTYATLFGVIGVEYGAGDNTTTFNLPDLLGRVPVGYGAGTGLTNRNDLGAKFGSETQTLTEANLPSHDHTIGWQADGTNSHDHALNSGSVTRVAGPSDGGVSSTGTINTGLSGSGTAHNNLQPSTVVNFIIKI